MRFSQGPISRYGEEEEGSNDYGNGSNGYVAYDDKAMAVMKMRAVT